MPGCRGRAVFPSHPRQPCHVRGRTAAVIHPSRRQGAALASGQPSPRSYLPRPAAPQSGIFLPPVLQGTGHSNSRQSPRQHVRHQIRRLGGRTTGAWGRGAAPPPSTCSGSGPRAPRAAGGAQRARLGGRTGTAGHLQGQRVGGHVPGGRGEGAVREELYMEGSRAGSPGWRGHGGTCIRGSIEGQCRGAVW